MTTSLGIFFVFLIFCYSNAQEQQVNRGSEVIVDTKCNPTLQEQYNSILKNRNYGDLIKLNRTQQNNNVIEISNRNDFDDQTVVSIDKIIFQQQPHKQFNPIPVPDELAFSLDDDFDWKFLKHMLLQNSSSNVIVSPFSIKLILSLLLEAAGEYSDTQSELFKIITKTPIKIEEISKYWNKTISSLQEPNKFYELLFGTKIYTDDFIRPTHKYAGNLKNFYNVDIESLPFKNFAETVNKINQWSSDATKGYIKNIISDEQLKSSVMLILNAIFFKGKWKYSFDKNESFTNNFYIDPKTKVPVEYMTKRDYYNYMDSNNLNAKIVQIPYEGNRFQLTLLLPRSKGGLEDLIHDITSANFKTLEWSVDDETEIKLTIPKLHFQYETSLKETLKAIGVNSIFGDNASLPLIDRGAFLNGQLRVSDIYQKSGLQIDETGTIAYAETVAAIENKFGGGIEDFNANRPFLFLIQDVREKTILFAGKIVNPNGF